MKLKTLILFGCMLVAVGAGFFLKPKPLYTAEGSHQQPKLAELVPANFGTWKVDQALVEQVVSPDLQAQLDKLYSQTLTRTYVNEKGQRVMLSLAYGADQGRSLKVHKPEVCYIAQGFSVGYTSKDHVQTDFGVVNVMRLVATQGNREEPITYWIRSGDDIVRGFVEQNISVLSAGLKGYIADGILVRVSTIDADKTKAYQMQDDFIRALLTSMNPQGVHMFVGPLGAKRS
jgi:EpsI family protein